MTRAVGILVLAALLALTGCSVEAAARRVAELAETTNGVAEKVESIAGKVEGAATVVQEQIRAADKDGDGRLSWTEIAGLLGVLAGGGGLLARAKTQREVDELYDDLHKAEAAKS